MLVNITAEPSPVQGPADDKWQWVKGCIRCAVVYAAQLILSNLLSNIRFKGTLSPSKAMENSGVITAALLLLLLLLLSCFVSPSFAVNTRSGDGYTITGRVKIEGMGSKGFGLPAKISNTKVILNGGQSVSFVRPDGYFSFYDVPAGTHLIEVAALGYFFSPVRVDISARNPGKVQAALTENRRSLQELVLESLREEQYYEIREPFSIMSLLKSPVGLMVGFMLIVVFALPKLTENMDPEEIRRAQEEMRSQGGLAGMLTGAATRSN